MIPRYTRPEMAAIWEPQTRFRIWFEIEAHAADAQAELGVIPKEAARTIWEVESLKKLLEREEVITDAPARRRRVARGAGEAGGPGRRGGAWRRWRPRAVPVP